MGERQLLIIFAPSVREAQDFMTEHKIPRYNAWIAMEPRDTLGLDRDAYAEILIGEDRWPKTVRDAHRSWSKRHSRPTHVTIDTSRDLAVLDRIDSYGR